MAIKKAKKKRATKTKQNTPVPKKGGGSKLTRSEIVQIRLDPKLRLAADLAAKMQRRTLSSFIEWSVSEAVGKVTMGLGGKETANKVASNIWDVDKADCFINQAIQYPELLTFDEEKLWKIIQQYQGLWATEKDEKKNLDVAKTPEKMNLSILRKVFYEFKQFAAGKLSDRDLISYVMSIKQDHEERIGD